MKPDIQLSIHKPCSANWNKMTPNDLGRFCGLCSHTVVDFSSMSDREIQNYFRCHSHQKTCGRFRDHQLLPQIRKRVSFKQMAVWCFTLLTFIAGCRKPPVPHKMGKVAIRHTYKENTK
jgi:hypothetical protein